MATPTEIRAHQEWLGFVQPVGLVVSPPALVAAQAQVDRNIAHEQETLQALVTRRTGGRRHEARVAAGPARVLRAVPGLGTGGSRRRRRQSRSAGHARRFAPRLRRSSCRPPMRCPIRRAPGSWLLLIRAEAAGTPLDEPLRGDDASGRHRRRRASSGCCARTTSPSACCTNRTHVRLVYAPPLESTGHLTFRIADLCTTSPAGRWCPRC